MNAAGPVLPAVDLDTVMSWNPCPEYPRARVEELMRHSACEDGGVGGRANIEACMQRNASINRDLERGCNNLAGQREGAHVWLREAPYTFILPLL